MTLEQWLNKRADDNYKERAHAHFIVDDGVEFNVNGRVAYRLTLPHKHIMEAVQILYDNFDDSYYLDFKTLDEVKEYFNV